MTTATAKSYVKGHMREALANHVLEVLCDAERVKAFRMRRPEGGSFYLVDIVFIPTGIGIAGDITLDHNGAWSREAKDLAWFRTEHSEDYLCSKFLPKVWVPEICAQVIREWASDADCEHREALYEIAKGIIDGELDRSDAYRDLSEIGYGDDGIPGYDYDPGDAGWLCAIQQRFRELMNSP